MNQIYSTEVLSLLTSWSGRPDAATDLHEIFGINPRKATVFLEQIKIGDFSWLPKAEILHSEILSPAIAAYARETATIYLSDNCPPEIINEAILEEIGHHIDALFNTEETAGDEGALFSATVRGIALSEREICDILNEDDSASILVNGSQLLVECIIPRMATLPAAPAAPQAKDTIQSAVSTLLPATAHGLVGTGLASISLTGNSPSSPLTYNYLQANSGNDTLIAGNAAATSMVGGSGNNWFLGGTGSQTDFFRGGSGNSTMVAANGAATLIGGTGNNSLKAGTGNQSLIGGAGANTLIGGIGNDTLRSGTGSNTLTSGSIINGGNTLIGGGVSNYLRASALGADSLTALSGASTLLGGGGSDTLLGGTGINSLVSGSTAVRTVNLSARAASGATTLTLSSVSGLAVGQSISGTGIRAGTVIKSISGNIITLSAVTNAAISSGASASVSDGNTLIGGAGSNTLIAGLGSDSLLGGSGTNYLNAGLNATALTMVGGAGSNTLVAGSLAGGESLVGGRGSNFLLINSQAQANQIGNDTISFLPLSTASQNTLGIASQAPISIQDSLFANVGSGYLPTIVDQTSSSSSITLGINAERAGVRTLISGTGSDTLSVASFANNSVLIDASRAVNRTSLVGGGTGYDTFLGSKGGYDTMIGASGNDLFVIQPSALNGSSFGLINGNGGTDTLQLNAAAGLTGTQFNGVSNVEVLQLGIGNNAVGSLQGSGIQKIIGNTGSDTLSANVYGAVRSVTLANSSTITLTVTPGTSATMGFAAGQVVTGNGIAVGTTITGVSSTAAVGSIPGTVTLTLSRPTTSLISQGGAVTGWLNGATLDGSAGYGLAPTDATKSQASTFINNAISSITAANYGIPNEAAIDTSLISALQFNPNSYIHRKGDFLTGLGQNQSLVGSNGNSLPTIPFNTFFSPQSGSGNQNIRGLPIGIQINQYQVVDNTLVSGAFATNTLVGGSGANLYLINNLSGPAYLPTIQNPTSLQSSSTIQFTGNGVNLNDTALSSVSPLAAQKIVTANGNNLISIGQNAAQIGIQTIIGGVGADTFVTQNDYSSSVYFDESKGVGNESLAAGSGNDTLLAGNGNATIVGGDGNNSLIGGSGNNLILSGVGNSTLDSGLGVSTLQADGGLNTFVVRNRYTRILNPYSLERDSVTGNITPPNPVPVATTPEIGIVNTYVNFDPIQSTNQNDPYAPFAPTQPDGSPSITKSPSFASSDLSSFFNLQYFNLLGSAVYGVGNALDNSMTSASANALMLGMGGNNTLVGNGANTSLYGYVNSTYANPDLYAAAPFDTRDQYFIDGVIGSAGNNYLIANGSNSYLDGGPGYNDGLGGSSGSNTLIGTKGGDTFFVRNQADVVVAATGGNELISTVDLHSIADNITRATLIVTKQAPNLPNIDPNNPTLPANSGQTDPATFLGFGNGVPNSSATDGFKDGALSININNATRLDVQYGTAEGEQYESDQGSVVPPTGFNSLYVGAIFPDPQNPFTAVATTLSWSAPTTGGAVVGYSVNYRIDNGDGTYGAWKTYVNGTSQDMTGTASNPSLTVDGLPTLTLGQSYDFRVTAQQLTLPTTTDPNTGLVTGTPVTLQGSNGNDIIWAMMPAESLFGGALVGYDSNAPILTNNVYGSIPVPNQPSPTAWDSYPVYMDAQNGNDLFVTQQIGNGDGSSYTVGGITYPGLHTMVGGIGSDTFVVSNGDTTFNNGVVTNGPNGFDLCIKYGNETPVNYSNVAPSTPAGIGTTGVSLNGGQHNLIISDVAAIQLSDQVVSQGMFVDELLVNGSGKFGEGNRLENFIYDVNTKTGANTLVGATGRDSIAGAGGKDVLIGGTATGMDSIAGALADYALNGSPSVSIYRDTDPTPTNALTGGPGLADPSQYWTQNGRLGGLVYNYLGNSDTLISTGGATMDGGAGSDSMIGAGGDTFYISSGGPDIYYDNAGVLTNRAKNNHAGYSDSYIPSRAGSPVADVVTEAGGTGTIVYTGSDVFWSGLPGATTAVLGYALSGTAISNITLQKGDAIARYATGSASSTGNEGLGGGTGEIGSNVLIGNEYGATLSGGGVGGGDGTGIGIDSLVGNAGNSTGGYAVSPVPAGTTIQSVTGTADTFIIGNNYTGSGADKNAITPDSVDLIFASGIAAFATDEDYAIINATASTRDLQNGGNAQSGTNTGASINLAAGTYVIGTAPSTFGPNNIRGGALDPNDFGIYKITTDKAGYSQTNLVAEIKGITLDATDVANLTSTNLAAVYQDTNSGLYATGTNSGNSMGGVNDQTYSNSTQFQTVRNFAGEGAFYNLAGTDFNTYHVHLG